LASLDLLESYFSETYICKSENTGHPQGMKVDKQHNVFGRVFRPEDVVLQPFFHIGYSYGPGEATLSSTGVSHFQSAYVLVAKLKGNAHPAKT
jgi:hypothetical protein